MADQMEVETKSGEVPAADNGAGKRLRDEGGEPENGENGDSLKKTKVQNSEEEQKVEILEGDANGDGEKKDDKSGPVTVGPKTFGSSVEMFDYFHNLLHTWSPNVNMNEYEHMVLLELLNKGHAESARKIGGGVGGFQARFHPKFKSKCYFIVREDGSIDDFSFRRCVDNILPLPPNMAVKSDANKGGRGGGGGGGGGRRGGRGRGKWRN